MQRVVLLSFEFSGIKNIKKKLSLKFYKFKIGKTINLQNGNIKGIYGENGAGKSAIISAMYVMKGVSLFPKYLSDYKTNVLLRNLINKNTNRAEFSCLFLI